MATLLSLIVCLAAQPYVCEVVAPDYVRTETGETVGFFECLGHTGQDIARQWMATHPEYLLRRVQCSFGSDPLKLREQIETPET